MLDSLNYISQQLTRLSCTEAQFKNSKEQGLK